MENPSLAAGRAGDAAYEMWFGRTIIVLQYWRSAEQLLSYATDKNAQHLPAWKAFNQAVGVSGDVGIWHETYKISPGSFENVYANMPAFGLGKAGTLYPASGKRFAARDRLSGTERG